jgi:hypothetical protein
MAEHPSRIWFGRQDSRGGISRRAMRLSVRHLGGLIYLQCGGRLCKGTKCNGTSEAQPLLQMRNALETPGAVADRCRIVLGSIFWPVRKRALTVDDLCRWRNFANAASTLSSSLIRVGAHPPVDGDRVCRPSSATAPCHARRSSSSSHPMLHRQDRRTWLPHGSLRARAFFAAHDAIATGITSES